MSIRRSSHGGHGRVRQSGERDRGAAMIEFALVLPLLLVLVIGIVDFGRAYNTQISIQGAAREGVRVAALRQSAGAAQAAVRAAAPQLNIDSIVVSGCPATGDGTATVTVREAFTFDIPFMSLGTKTLTATARMRCGV